jgi:enoyl-CoA hydratase/carnithine racemase
MIGVEDRGAVRVLTIDRPPVNALDVAALRSLADLVYDCAGSAVTALVLTGAGPVFSAGLDLYEFTSSPGAPAELAHALSRACLALMESPLPIVAAINGSAIAGGCVLACACDVRLAAPEPLSIGATEVAVGLPIPAVPLEVLRAVLGSTAILRSTQYGPAEAAAAGVVESIDAELIPAAVAVATELGGRRPGVFAHVKSQLNHVVLSRLAAARNVDQFDQEVLRAWQSPQTEAHIRDYLRARARARAVAQP